MDTQIITTIISILWWVLIASITYYLTKKKEEEFEWKKEKLRFYIEFIESLSWITDWEKNLENEIRYAKACNNLHLFATSDVLFALQEFREKAKWKDFDYVPYLTILINEIRKDIKVKRLDNNLNFYLATSKSKK